MATNNAQVFRLGGIDHPVEDVTARGEIDTIVNNLGAKNRNSYPYKETTKSDSGLVFTDLGDGRVLVTYGDGSSSGHPSANTGFTCHTRFNNDNPCVLKNGKYTLSGCPEGGSESDYSIYVAQRAKNTGTFTKVASDTGEGATFTLDGDYYNDDSVCLAVEIDIKSSATIPAGGFIFNVMITDESILDKTFEPYAMTNRELTDYVNAYVTSAEVDISSYTSGNQYTFPSDGYLNIMALGAIGDYIRGCVGYGTNIVNISAYKAISANHGFNAVYVKKGMKYYTQTTIGTTKATFVALS